MLKEAIQQIQDSVHNVEASKAIFKDDDGNTHALLITPNGTVTNRVHESERMPKALETSTLQSVVDYVNDRAEVAPASDMVSMVLASPTRVSVLGELTARARRAEYLVANAKHAFPSQDFMAQEDFVMMLLRCFRDAYDRAELLALVGNMSTEAVRTASDDGVTQLVSTKQGTRLGFTPTKATYHLAPRAPFPEVTLESSPWFLRVRNDNNGPRVALFDASGGEYLKDANAAVGEWLTARLPGVTVLR